ncbi:hypothetical protein Rruber_05156 (plasmid) [Rhodococcus ruber]
MVTVSFLAQRHRRPVVPEFRPRRPPLDQQMLQIHRMRTTASRADVRNRFGPSDPFPHPHPPSGLPRLEGPGDPARLARDLGGTRTHMSNHPVVVEP